MINLFIDATQSYCHLAILNDQIIVKKMKVKTNNNLTEMIVEHIENLLQLVKINHQDVKKILLVVGPGSFTGVRIGVLIAKAWSLVYQIPVYTINALLLQTPNGSGLSILDARGDLVYVSAYQNNKCLIKPQVMKVAEAELLIPQYKYLSVYIQYKSADIFNNLIYHISNFKKVTNIHKLHPLYIKQPL